MRNKKGTRGFTILELLVVITMLGILIATLLPHIIKQLDKPKKGRAMLEIKTMKNALDIYYAENNEYPTEKKKINSLMKENGVLAGKYGTKDATDPWGNPYYINTSVNSYCIWSKGPDGETTTDDDIFTTDQETDILVNMKAPQSTDTTNSQDDS